jgi:hypothetical protein
MAAVDAMERKPERRIRLIGFDGRWDARRCVIPDDRRAKPVPEEDRCFTDGASLHDCDEIEHAPASASIASLDAGG